MLDRFCPDTPLHNSYAKMVDGRIGEKGATEIHRRYPYVLDSGRFIAEIIWDVQQRSRFINASAGQVLNNVDRNFPGGIAEIKVESSEGTSATHHFKRYKDLLGITYDTTPYSELIEVKEGNGSIYKMVRVWQFYIPLVYFKSSLYSSVLDQNRELMSAYEVDVSSSSYREIETPCSDLDPSARFQANSNEPVVFVKFFDDELERHFPSDFKKRRNNKSKVYDWEKSTPTGKYPAIYEQKLSDPSIHGNIPYNNLSPTILRRVCRKQGAVLTMLTTAPYDKNCVVSELTVNSAPYRRAGGNLVDSVRLRRADSRLIEGRFSYKIGS